MSYQLQKNEPLGPGIKRIAFEQIDETLAYLQTPADDLDEAVHESRKCFKKLRGLLRLVRKEVGESVYKQENTLFRDAGRLLSELRDSAVRIKTVDDLREDAAADSIDDEALASLRETLVIFYHATRQRTEEEQSLAKAAEMVQTARGRVESWPINDDGFTAVAGGLRKIYKRGRNRLQDAADTPTAEAFHEWRKRVKYLWYSMRILQSIWPDPMAVLADEIHDLSDYLGDEHDLAELIGLLERRPSLLDDDSHSQAAFLALIADKRAALQARAYPLGEAIYVESPDAYVERMAGYWQAARS